MTNHDQIMQEEAAVIGGMFIDGKLIPQIYAILRPEDFQIPEHRELYEGAVRAYISAQGDISAEILSGAGAEARRAISYALDHTVSAHDALAYAEIVRRRALAGRANEILYSSAGSIGDNAGTEEQINGVAERLAALTGDKRRLTLDHVGGGMLVDTVAGLWKPEQGGVSFGFPALDALAGSLLPGHLCVIGARPSVGKTAFACNIALNCLRSGRRPAIYSLEMSREEILLRILSRMAQVNITRLTERTAKPDEIDRVASEAAWLHEQPLYISDNMDTTVAQMALECRFRKADMIFIDYLQLIRLDGRFNTTNDRLGAVSRSLKKMAKELNIPVVVLSQLNRETAQRDGAKPAATLPTLAHLRDSGAIEQDADKVFLMSRHEPGCVLVDVAKNKQGECGKVVFMFDGAVMEFADTNIDYEQNQDKRQKREDPYRPRERSKYARS